MLTHCPDDGDVFALGDGPVVAVGCVEEAPEVERGPDGTRGLVVGLLTGDDPHVLLLVQRHSHGVLAPVEDEAVCDEGAAVGHPFPA